MRLIYRQSTVLPLPKDFRDIEHAATIEQLTAAAESTELGGYSAEKLQETVLNNERIRHRWLRHRIKQPRMINPPLKGGGTILGLELFLDKWLLVIYAEGHISLWDAYEAKMEARKDLVRLNSSSASLIDGKTVVIALTRENGYVITGLTAKQYQ
jgi:hypothetical protein